MTCMNATSAVARAVTAEVRIGDAVAALREARQIVGEEVVPLGLIHRVEKIVEYLPQPLEDGIGDSVTPGLRAENGQLKELLRSLRASLDDVGVGGWEVATYDAVDAIDTSGLLSGQPEADR